jgi:outer membrane protein OmpA-like peptidoglycan-associated protein
MIKSSGIPNQVFAKGCTYNKSLVPNTTPENMALNRRVEIYLYPNQQAVVDQCR